MKVCMIEACEEQNKGSIGAFYVRHHAELAGYPVDVLNDTAFGYDVELISVHHFNDFPRLAALPKRAKWRLVGGHPMQNNPRPCIPFADAICIGEGESWIKKALSLLDKQGDIDALADLSGTIVCKNWAAGDTVPEANYENPLPENPPYLNYPGTRDRMWYIEIARGCPFSCSYCELGNSSPYRRYSKEQIFKVVDQINTSLTKKINVFAPDEAAHPEYNEIMEYIRKTGYFTNFSSMRVDSVLKNRPAVKINHLIRVGIDGLTEKTRFLVNKKITDQMIFDYFKTLLGEGYCSFKMFMIIGYPWDNLEDFKEWERLMECIFSIPIHKRVMLRIKWTPLIPQPCTPLADAITNYTPELYHAIQNWHARHRLPNRSVGWHVTNDGLMSFFSHKRQCELTSGDEFVLQKEVKR